MIPKQPISLFYGATDQDTSKKKAQLGDMVIAQNCRQVKGGEFSKRDGFTQTTQSYAYPGGRLVTPESITSPDGVQVLTKDAYNGHAYARSSSATLNQDQGAADRFIPYVRTRMAATGSDEMQVPMAKQAGNYLVWLVDEGHFKVAQLNPGVLTSPTDDAETIVLQSAEISVSTISGTDSTRIKSFAVIDLPSFDSDRVWIIWVDWSNTIYAYALNHDDLATGSFYVVATAAALGTDQVSVLTSIAAGIVTTALVVGGVNAVRTELALAVCGVAYDTSAHYISPGHAGNPATGFRTATNEPANNYGQTFSGHCYLTNTGALVAGTSLWICTGSIGKATAAACTIASVKGFQTDPTTWYYAFIGNGPAGDWSVVLIKVSGSSYTPYFQYVSVAALDTYGLPADWSATNYSRMGWFYNGQLAAQETATGVDVAATIIPYYCPSNGTTVLNGIFRAWNPDYLATHAWAFDSGTENWSSKWIKLGCCVAQGWIRLRDYSATGANAFTVGVDYLLTIWEDKEAYQTCYHVRAWDTGEIVAQLAYGEAAHVGHVATRDLQAQEYYSDVQQPMLLGVNQQTGLPLSIIVGLQSANQNASVDVAAIVLANWDFVTGAPPIWENPASVFNFALSPGPIPTVHNGFQRVREAGPLVYPSRLESYVGAGSS